MNFDDFVKERIALFARQTTNKEKFTLQWGTVAFCGEMGEFANLVKKIYRDHGGFVNGRMKEELTSELGDIIWYWLFLCENLGLNVNEIFFYNIQKLKRRYSFENIREKES